MLKELGRTGKVKKVKCKKCSKQIDVYRDEIINTNGRKTIYCQKCGTENVLK